MAASKSLAAISAEQSPTFYARKPDGAKCNKDDECQSGDCHKGAGKDQNKCKPHSHKLPNGATCQKDSQCASGDCHKGDGPFKNVCKDHKSNGQSCSKDADCASGDCHTGHSGSDAKDRVVYGESCDHEKQHWKIIQL